MDREILIATSEIIKGIEEGIVPDKPGTHFHFLKEQLVEINRDIINYEELMREKYQVSRKGYLELIPPGAERKLGYELYDRKVRLARIAYSHLIHQNLLMPREELIKYARPELGYMLTYSPEGVVTEKVFAGLPPK